MFLGQAGGHWIAGGGFEANNKPSSDVWVSSGSGGWEKHQLAYPVAYAATASVSLTENRATVTKLVLVGGYGTDGPTTKVQILEFLNGQLRQSEIAPLPRALSMAGAGFFDDQPQRQLYVAGGTSSPPYPATSAALFRFDFDAPHPGWEQLPDMPGGGRVLPAVACLYNDVLVFGGFTPREPTDRAEAFRWKVVDGTTFTGWRTLPPLPKPLGAPAVFQTGQVHVALAGGASGSQAENSEPSSDIFVFHDVTETWTRKGSLPEPLAIPAILRNGEAWVFLGNTESFDITLQRTVRSLALKDYLGLFGYFAIVAFAGIWFVRKQKGSEAFALGDRKVPWWMAGISMFATGASSISFMAIPAQSFRTSLIWALPTLMLIPLFFVEAYVLYPLIRRLRITSTFEYLERRFHPSLRFIASAQCIALQMFGRMNMVMLLPALAIHAVTGMNVFYSVLLMGAVTTAYTAKGGLKAVILTEVIQGITMLAGISMILWLAVSAVPGGLGGFVATGKQFGRFDIAIWSWDSTLPVAWILILTPLINKIAVAADQPVIQRVFATPLRDVRKAAAIFLVCSVVISFAVTLAGVAVFTYFHAHPDKLDIAMTNDQVIPLYIVQRLPAGIAGLIIAALFSAAASALAGSMNSVAILFTEDFYRKMKRNVSDRERLMVMRGASVGAGVVATVCALYMASLNQRSLFQTWNELFALLGGGFLGIYILGTYTRRANSIGAFTGAIASVLATVFAKAHTQVHWYAYMPIAATTCVSVGYLISLVTPRHRGELTGLTAFDVRRDLVEDDAIGAAE